MTYFSNITEQASRNNRVRHEYNPSPELVLKKNKMRLYFFPKINSSKTTKFPILIVPSMINRHYILNLCKNHSLVEFLQIQGFDVYLLDWGIPKDEDRFISLEDYIGKYLKKASTTLLRHSKNIKFHLMGYCMGATLSFIHASLNSSQIISIINLLGPLDFEKSEMLRDWTQVEVFKVNNLVDAMGQLPPELLNSSFEMMRPIHLLKLKKREIDQFFSSKVKPDDFFKALKAWTEDNIPFPGEAYREYITQFYQQNNVINGNYKVFGKKVDLKIIKCPCLMIAATEDHIVPIKSAQVHINSKTQFLTVKGGHVGSVVGKKASKELWPKISTWLFNQEVIINECH